MFVLCRVKRVDAVRSVLSDQDRRIDIVCARVDPTKACDLRLRRISSTAGCVFGAARCRFLAAIGAARLAARLIAFATCRAFDAARRLSNSSSNRSGSSLCRQAARRTRLCTASLGWVAAIGLTRTATCTALGRLRSDRSAGKEQSSYQ